MRNLALLFSSICLFLWLTSLLPLPFCIQMPFSFYSVYSTLCWVAVPLPLQWIPSLPQPCPVPCPGGRSPPQECPSCPAWALNLHTRLHFHPRSCRYIIIILLGLWYLQQAIHMRGCPHFTQALTPYTAQPSYTDAPFALFRSWHPALGYWGSPHPIMDNYFALPHLKTSGLNCSGRKEEDFNF